MLGLIKQLPPPPLGKEGWPWTEETNPQFYDCKKDWPKISIVTPTYNQGQFIEETIRSVILQNYPNLEYIIIDGGSNDETTKVIEKYSTWLSYWVSEKDNGQSHAINKGFLRSSGDILGWLNSDDIYSKNIFSLLAFQFKASKMIWWTGSAKQFNSCGEEKVFDVKPVSYNRLLFSRHIISQVSTFWTRSIWVKSGSVVNEYNLAMDFDLWLRFARLCKPILLNHVLASYRSHDLAKTSQKNQGMRKYIDECDLIRARILGKDILKNVKINIYTRIFMVCDTKNLKHVIGRRQIPYV